MKSSKRFTATAVLLAGSLAVAPVYANDHEGSGMGGQDYEKNLEVIFNQVDQDGDGSLTLEEVKDFAKFMHVMKGMFHHGYHHQHHGEMGKNDHQKYHHYKGKTQGE